MCAAMDHDLQKTPCASKPHRFSEQVLSELFGISNISQSTEADRGKERKDKISQSPANEYSGSCSKEANSLTVCKSSHFAESQFSLLKIEMIVKISPLLL